MEQEENGKHRDWVNDTISNYCCMHGPRFSSHAQDRFRRRAERRSVGKGAAEKPDESGARNTGEFDKQVNRRCCRNQTSSSGEIEPQPIFTQALQESRSCLQANTVNKKNQTHCLKIAR